MGKHLYFCTTYKPLKELYACNIDVSTIYKFV